MKVPTRAQVALMTSVATVITIRLERGLEDR
jgi:hypothetical protein